ncbi:hypothetical protein GGP41_003903 [Bipolaris sorokiniana]|uniref:Uncharacterized protein n=1 Tax=Cochliobolus sativus TaxID=45130 RepID=A0A8H5Z9S4_COCSA|nr:hypothetical protein GGP41_003903 [Bipolaris sorokiniana]
MARGRNITIDKCNIVIRTLQAGIIFKEVAIVFYYDASTIRQLHDKFNTTRTTCNRPRTSGPKVIFDYQKKKIKRIARQSPKFLFKYLVKKAIFVHTNGTTSKAPSRLYVNIAIRDV